MTLGVILALAALAAGWTAALVAAPMLPATAGAILYAIGSLVCHQIPERSFYVGGFQLPVCGRCLGLYAGSAVGLLGACAAAVLVPHRWRLSSRALRVSMTAAAAVPTAATAILEHVLGWPLSNATRALAAVPLAASVAFVVAGAVATVHYGECTRRRPLGHDQSLPPAST